MNESPAPTSSAQELSTSQPAPATTDPLQSSRQRFFLLQQLRDAPGQRLSRSAANSKIPAAVVRELGLTPAIAQQVRNSLAAERHLAIIKTGRSVAYELTEQGRAYLQTLPAYAPPTARGAVKPASTPDIQRWRKSYLLLQLFLVDRPKMPQAEANKFSDSSRKFLELNAATASHLRRQLSAAGLLEISSEAGREWYALTPAGRLSLGTLDIYPAAKFHLSGKQLAALLEAARDAAKQFETPAPSSAQPAAPITAAQLTNLVLEAASELQREKYHMSGLVPIHEVRQGIRSRFGEQAARHAALDDVILGLWRQKRLRLVSIPDRSAATEQQLQDSIEGVGETLFYLEVAHEPAVL